MRHNASSVKALAPDAPAFYVDDICQPIVLTNPSLIRPQAYSYALTANSAPHGYMRTLGSRLQKQMSFDSLQCNVVLVGLCSERVYIEIKQCSICGCKFQDEVVRLHPLNLWREVDRFYLLRAACRCGLQRARR